MAYARQNLREDVDENATSEEADALRAALASILMHHGDIGADEVYALVFSDGARLTWH